MQVTMKGGNILVAEQILGRLLSLHQPRPRSEDGGRSSLVGFKLRRINRAVRQAAADVREQIAAVPQGVDGPTDKERQEIAQTVLDTTVAVDVPELLADSDFETIPLEAELDVPDAAAPNGKRTLRLRWCTADLEDLGPLVGDNLSLDAAPSPTT